MDNIRVGDESLYDWRSTLTEETDCDCEGCGQDPCVKCGKSHHNINEEIQGGVSVENYADGVQFNEIETVDIIKPKALDPSNWRSELTQVNERYKFIGPGKGKKASDKDMTKNKGEKIGVDYSRIQAKADKKKEVVAASNEIEGDLVDEGLLTGALSGAKLIAKVTPKVFKTVVKGGQALARKGAGDITKFKKTRELVRRYNNIADIRASKASKPLIAPDPFTTPPSKTKFPFGKKPVELKLGKSTIPSTGSWYKQPPLKLTKPSDVKKPQSFKDFSKKIKALKKDVYRSPDPFTTPSPKKPIEPFGKNPVKLDGLGKSTIPTKKTSVTTSTTKKITGSAGTQYKNPIGANPTAKTQYKDPIGANPTAKTQHNEPIGPNLNKSQKSALTGKATDIIKQLQGKNIVNKKTKETRNQLDARIRKGIDSSRKKGTYSYKIDQLLKLPDPKVKSPISTPTPTKKSTPTPKKDEGGKAIKRVIGGAVSATGYNLVTGGKKKKEVKEGVASVVLKNPLTKKAIAKAAGAVFAAKGGEKILKDLLGTPDQPKRTDWDKNPKDKIDQELNVRQNQAKDAAKNKEFDTDMKAYRKGKKNLTDDQKIQRLRDAKKKRSKD
jgi:hypothetical protein